jgi:hypothetical protein
MYNYDSRYYDDIDIDYCPDYQCDDCDKHEIVLHNAREALSLVIDHLYSSEPLVVDNMLSDLQDLMHMLDYEYTLHNKKIQIKRI